MLTQGTGDVNAVVYKAGGVQVVSRMHIRLARELRPSAACAGLPRGKALLAEKAQCSKALRQPAVEQDEHVVDLSPQAPPSKQGELLSSTSQKETRGPTRSFWLHKHSQLSDLMMEKLKETGTSSPLLPAMSPTACCEVGQAQVVLQAFV